MAKLSSSFWSRLVLLYWACACLAVNHCYYPNQAEAADDAPCNPDAEASACCGGGIGTVCLSNGLCQGPNGAIIRGSCSDKYWSAEECAAYCLSATRGGTDLVSCANVTKDDTSYCCNGAENCCDSGDGRFSVGPHNPTTSATWNAASTRFVVIGAASTSSSSTSASQTTSSSSTGTSQATVSSPSNTISTGDTTGSGPAGNTAVASQPDTTPPTGPATSPSSELSSGAKAGIGIGATVGALLIAGLIYALWRLQKVQGMLAKDQPEVSSDYSSGYPAPPPAMASNTVNAAPAVPPKNHGQIPELYGHYSPLHELPANST